MNAYNIFKEESYSTIEFHAIAESEAQVKKLAKEANIDLEGYTIELERFNVKTELGRSYEAKIENCIV